MEEQSLLSEKAGMSRKRMARIITLVLLVMEIINIALTAYMSLNRRIYPGTNLQMAAAIIPVVLIVVIICYERRRERMEQEQLTAQLETRYYRNVQERRMLLEEFQKQYAAHLDEMIGLVESGDAQAAEKQLRQGHAQLLGTRENRWCSIPVVNAVLDEAWLTCCTKGITLEARMDIPSGLHMEQMDLVSVLANLLNNAIEACEELPDPQKQISLSGEMKGDYLCIRLSNPTPASGIGRRKERHAVTGLERGYGSRILRSIAERYHGEYRTYKKQGQFTADIVLLT